MSFQSQQTLLSFYYFEFVFQIIFRFIFADKFFGVLSLVDSDTQPPSFVQEPPARLIFGNSTGSQISCLVHGKPPPIVTWHLRDGELINGVPGLRYVLSIRF